MIGVVTSFLSNRGSDRSRSNRTIIKTGLDFFFFFFGEDQKCFSKREIRGFQAFPTEDTENNLERETEGRVVHSCL